MRAIRAWADVAGVEIHLWLHDSETGTTDERPNFQTIKGLNAEGRVGRVLVARQDRVARNSAVADLFWKELRQQGAELVNVQVQIDDTPFGKVIRKLLDSFAELDRDLIVERTSKGSKEKVRATGLHHGGVCPTGYRFPTAAERAAGELPKGTLVVDERAAEAVRAAFALRERGHSHPNIARWLNRRGYVGLKGGRFSAGTVNSIVRREAFYRTECVSMSRAKLGVTEEEYAAIVPIHPPILPPRPPGQADLADRVQRTPMKFAHVPDDPFSDEPLRQKMVNTITSVTRDYGAALLAMQELLDAGGTYDGVAEALNRRGHRTRHGCSFSGGTVHRVERMLHRLLPLAREAVSRPEPQVIAADERSGDERAALHEAQRLARTRSKEGKRAMSYAQIAARLNEEYRTERGAAYHPMTVRRMLLQAAEAPTAERTVAYVRLTKSGDDLQGQHDQIEEWAEVNGLTVDEWYVDRGPAHKGNDLPEMRRLLADAEEAKFQRIAVTNRDLLCRDPDVAERIVRRLSAAAEVHLVGQTHASIAKRPSYAPPYALRYL